MGNVESTEEGVPPKIVPIEGHVDGYIISQADGGLKNGDPENQGSSRQCSICPDECTNKGLPQKTGPEHKFFLESHENCIKEDATMTTTEDEPKTSQDTKPWPSIYTRETQALILENEDGTKRFNFDNVGVKTYVIVKCQSVQQQLNKVAKQQEAKHQRPSGWYTALVAKHLSEYKLNAECLLVYEHDRDKRMNNVMMKMDAFLWRYHRQRFVEDSDNY